MISTLTKLLRNEDGATAIEYTMIVLFVALLLIAVVLSIRTSVKGFFQQIANGF